MLSSERNNRNIRESLDMRSRFNNQRNSNTQGEIF